MGCLGKHGTEGDLVLSIQPENMVMVATNMSGRSLSWESGYMGLCENIHF